MFPVKITLEKTRTGYLLTKDGHPKAVDVMSLTREQLDTVAALVADARGQEDGERGLPCQSTAAVYFAGRRKGFERVMAMSEKEFASR